MLRSSFSWLGDEVLYRELIWVLVYLDHIILLPEVAFVEDDVARHMSLPPCRIIEFVCLAPGFIADEDDLQALRIELGEVGTRYLHVCDAVKHSKMMYC